MTQPRVAQGPVKDLQLHTLGWSAFQALCNQIISVCFHQPVTSFSLTNDGGRDGAFQSSEWNPISLGVPGTGVIQAKFSAHPQNTLTLAALTEELNKATVLAQKNAADNYVLMTNQSVNGKVDLLIREALTSIPGIKHFELFAGESIAEMIQKERELRSLVPRVYGLGNLAEIIDERAYEQAREILDTMSGTIDKFVPTLAYRRALSAALNHNFVLLIGEAASGKSSIAATLSLAFMDEGEYEPIKVTEPGDIQTHSNPTEPKQLFWIDDAFGATQYQRVLSDAWIRQWPYMKSAIRRGAVFVLTTRDYIFQQARGGLKPSEFPLLDNSQVIIKVEELTLDEKRQILYNHVRMGDQPSAFKTEIKPFLDEVAKSSKFKPEIARRLGDQRYTSRLVKTQEGLLDFVTRPMEFLVDTITELDSEMQGALVLLYMGGGRLSIPIQSTKIQDEVIRSMSASFPGVIAALEAMKDSMVMKVGGGQPHWLFAHPTLADAIRKVVSKHSQLFDAYILGSKPKDMMLELACAGASSQEGALIIPTDRYSDVIDRFGLPSGRVSVDLELALLSFLQVRADREFLEMFCSENSEFLERLCASSGYEFVDEPRVALLGELLSRGIATERHRHLYVKSISFRILDLLDPRYLSNQKLASLIEGEEREAILDEVSEELLARLEVAAEEAKHESSTSNNSSEVASLRVKLETFANLMDDYPVQRMRIEDLGTKLEDWQDGFEAHLYEEAKESGWGRASDVIADAGIFEDVDAPI